jgi:hypothetical protein
MHHRHLALAVKLGVLIAGLTSEAFWRSACRVPGHPARLVEWAVKGQQADIETGDPELSVQGLAR